MKFLKTVNEFTEFLIKESRRENTTQIYFRLRSVNGKSIVKIIGWQEMCGASYNDFQAVVRFSKNLLNHFLTEFNEEDSIKLYKFIN